MVHSEGRRLRLAPPGGVVGAVLSALSRPLYAQHPQSAQLEHQAGQTGSLRTLGACMVSASLSGRACVHFWAFLKVLVFLYLYGLIRESFLYAQVPDVPIEK